MIRIRPEDVKDLDTREVRWVFGEEEPGAMQQEDTCEECDELLSRYHMELNAYIPSQDVVRRLESRLRQTCPQVWKRELRRQIIRLESQEPLGLVGRTRLAELRVKFDEV